MVDDGPAGHPQARQKLINGEWQADGLLPPNPQARELFAALLFALTSPDDLRALYPSAQAMDLTRTLPGRWQIVYQSSEVFRVNISGQPLSYRITPLERPDERLLNALGVICASVVARTRSAAACLPATALACAPKAAGCRSACCRWAP